MEMVQWCNSLPGTEVDIEGYPLGQIEYVRSVSHSIHAASMDENIVSCIVVVNVQEVVKT